MHPWVEISIKCWKKYTAGFIHETESKMQNGDFVSVSKKLICEVNVPFHYVET